MKTGGKEELRLIPDSFIAELKYASDIEQVISAYVRLTRRGKTLVGLCPFHNEKTPSFTVYPEEGHFYCFGCGAGGDVITFIRRAENLDYVEAVRLLAERAGMTLPEDERDEAGQWKMRLLECNRAAARFFHDTLASPAGARGLRYLRARALGDDTIRRFGLGYAPAGWDALTSFLRSKGYSREELIEARLASGGRKGDGCFDLFRDRVIFPIIDVRGNVVGFGGRALEDGGPKYLNSPDTAVFKKSRNLFALEKAKQSKSPSLILAEGYMDVIALHQAGFTNAVATLGTALTAEQTGLIAKYAEEVILSYDSDAAGQKATRRAIGLFAQTGVRVRVLHMEGAKDPDEFIKRFGATRFKMLLEGSRGAVEFEIERLRGGFDLETAEGKVGFLGEFVRLMAGIPNAIERDVYIRRTAGELGVSPEAVEERVRQQRKRMRSGEDRRQQRDLKMYAGAGAVAAKADPERERNLRFAVAEERLLSLIMRRPEDFPYIAARIRPEQFVTSRNRRLYGALCTLFEAGRPIEALSSVVEMEDMAYLTGLAAANAAVRPQSGEADDYIRTILSHEKEKTREELAGMNDADWAEWLASSRTEHGPFGVLRKS